jgi:6-phosphogluconolactonase
VSRETLVRPAAEVPGLLAARLEAAAAEAGRARGRFAIALTGGSVAEAAYPRLAGARLDWSRTHVFWGDERAVPPDDPRSNHGLARHLWLARVPVPAENVHRMVAEGPDLGAAARAYEAELRRVLGSPPALDVALVGVGPDGHVCSLFPGHPLLAERVRLVAAVEDAPKPPPRRLTLTLPALFAAELLLVVALGRSKAEAVAEALGDPGSALPLAVALRGARQALVVLDGEAAGRTGGRVGRGER